MGRARRRQCAARCRGDRERSDRARRTESGGKVAALAATLGEVDFVVSLSSGALPVKDALFHELEQTYRSSGRTAEEIEELQRLTALSFEYLETGSGFDAYLERRDAITARFGPRWTRSWPATEDDDYWVFWGPIHDFDPLPVFREVVDERGIPTFFALGVLDEEDNVPVTASVRRLGSELEGAGLVVRVYADTGHSLMDEALRARGEMKLVDPLVADLAEWLETVLADGDRH